MLSVAQRPEAADEQRPTASRLFVRPRLTASISVWSCILFLAALVLLASAPGLVTEHEPNQTAIANRLEGPSIAHPFGTDELGRDVFSRVLHGARVSLVVAVGATGLALVVGIGIGLAAVWGARVGDVLLMRLVDVALAMPVLVLAMVLVVAFGSGIPSIVAALGLVSVPEVARLTHAQARAVSNAEFVTAAIAAGAHPRRVLLRHIAPNAVSPAIVYSAQIGAFAILIEASLSFLGAGLAPPTPTWGGILQDGYRILAVNPWPAILPGLVVTATVAAFSLLGDRVALRLNRKAQ
ncbi:MAG TPA: ABC transporter permease [Gemmatimonadales bacterium]|nr:ABC transporter permease [Gemmatimonadales bacterium]